MSYKLKNTALDPSKRFLHRTAHKMQMEPVIGGRRLRIRTSMTISDELFEHNKPNLELWRKWGVVDWEQEGGEKKPETPVIEPPTDTPTDAPKGTPKAVDVMLVEVGDNAIGVVKVLREKTSMELKEASDLLAMVPVVVLSGASEAAAKELDSALSEAGAKVELVWVPYVDKEPPPAETAPSKETKPQPKSPFKGKSKS